jgi:hypothetical protein
MFVPIYVIITVAPYSKTTYNSTGNCSTTNIAFSVYRIKEERMIKCKASGGNDLVT